MPLPLTAKGELTGRAKKNAFAALEMLVAMTIIAMAIASILPMLSSAQSQSLDAQKNQEAFYKAQSLLEQQKALAALDFNLANPHSAIQSGIYRESVDVSQIDFFTKKITSRVSWNNSLYSFEESVLVTNPYGFDTGDTCSSLISGNWKNPQIQSYLFGANFLGDSTDMFPISSIDANNKALYVALSNSSNTTSPIFFKFDISNQDQIPLLVSGTDNNPSVKSGLAAIKTSGNYAYAASAYGANYTSCTQSISCSQLQIIDTNSMAVVSWMKMPGVTGNSGQAIGNSIFYENGIVYLGLAKTATGPEFNIIDVGGGGLGGSPQNPVYMGGVDIGNGVNGIIVKNNRAYVASPNDQELIIIDVNNPQYPQRVGQFNAPDGGGNYGNGKSLALAGQTLYLGRTLASGNELYILDNRNPASTLPVFFSQDVKDQSLSNQSVNGIIIKNSLVFLLTNDEFDIFEQDPASYALSQYASALPVPSGKGKAADCEGDYIYFSSLPSDNKSYISIVKAGP